MRKLLALLALFLLPITATGQTLLSSSPALVGTSAPLALTVQQYQEYNIFLTANTPIQFDVPVISGTLIFRLNLCESNSGGWSPIYSIVQGGNTLVNNLASTMLNTANGACETQQWSWQQKNKKLILESDTAITGTPGSLQGIINPTGPPFGAVAFTGTLPTGTIAASGTTLTLSAPFIGQFPSGGNVYVGVIGAGASTTMSTPSAPTNDGSACAGTCTTQYAVEQVDIGASDDWTAKSAAFSFSNNATLSLSAGNYLKITPDHTTNPSAVQHAYYLSRDNGATYALWGCFPDATVDLYIASNTAPNAYGCPNFMPSTPPASAQPQILVSKVNAGGGTASLTLQTAATNAATSQIVYPLSEHAINAATTAAGNGGRLYFPSGTYYTSQQIAMGQNQVWDASSTLGATIKAVDQVTAGPMFDMVRTGSGQSGRTLTNMTIDANNMVGGLRNVDNQALIENVTVTGSQLGPAIELKGTQNSTLINVTAKYSLNGLLLSYNSSLGICAANNKIMRGELQTISGYYAALISPGTGSQVCYQNVFDNTIIGDFPFAPHYTDLTTDAGSNMPQASLILVNAVRNSFVNGTSIFGVSTANDLTLGTVVSAGCTNCISGAYDTLGTSNWFTNVDFSGAPGMNYAAVPAFTNHEVKNYILQSAFSGWTTNPIIVSDRLMNVLLPINAYYSGAVTDTGNANQKVSWLDNNLAGSGWTFDLGEVNLNQASATPLSITGATSGTLTIHPPAIAGTGTDLTFPGTSSVMLANAISTMTYGATVTPNLNLGMGQHVTITDTNPWTLAAPTNATTGQSWILDVSNGSGGAAGAINISAYSTDGSFTAPSNTRRVTCQVLNFSGPTYYLYGCEIQAGTQAFNGSSGTATCTQDASGPIKTTSCYLNAYAQTGAAQTFTYPLAYSTSPVLLETAGSCGTYNPSTSATVLTLPANAAMTAETCNVIAIGQ